MGIVELVVLVVVIAFFGWDRYRGGRKSRSGSAAQPTTELFIDPATGQRMCVWYDPSTGQREYRPE